MKNPFTSKCENCGHRTVRDLRGPLTLLVVLFTFALAFARLLLGQASETLIPVWVGQLATGTLSMYFVSKGGERMREMTNQRRDREDDKESKE